MNTNDLIAKGYVKQPDGSYRRPAGSKPVNVHAPPSETQRLKIHLDNLGLNKTERARLEHLIRCGLEVGIHNITLKLGDDCRFTTDLNYWEGNRLIMEDVKGHQRDDALVKIKVAARMYAKLAEFRIVKREGIGWKVTVIKP